MSTCFPVDCTFKGVGSVVGIKEVGRMGSLTYFYFLAGFPPVYSLAAHLYLNHFDLTLSLFHTYTHPHMHTLTHSLSLSHTLSELSRRVDHVKDENVKLKAENHVRS